MPKSAHDDGASLIQSVVAAIDDATVPAALAIAHTAHAAGVTCGAARAWVAYEQTRKPPLRSRDQIAAFSAGFDLADPGAADVGRRCPDGEDVADGARGHRRCGEAPADGRAGHGVAGYQRLSGHGPVFPLEGPAVARSTRKPALVMLLLLVAVIVSHPGTTRRFAGGVG